MQGRSIVKLDNRVELLEHINYRLEKMLVLKNSDGSSVSINMSAGILGEKAEVWKRIDISKSYLFLG
jgi:hypothetical protein